MAFTRRRNPTGSCLHPHGARVMAVCALPWALTSTACGQPSDTGRDSGARVRFEAAADTDEGETQPPFQGASEMLMVDPSSWTLDSSGEAAPAEAPDEGDVHQLVSDIWMLSDWTPDFEDETSLSALPAQFTLTTPLARRGYGPTGRSDRWTTGLYREDAELLTPLGGGRELLSWNLGDRVSLLGVGSRRVWTERDRAFVLSAEAAWRLSARAGLHVGYEVLQASADSGLDREGGESVFARFQLRF